MEWQPVKERSDDHVVNAPSLNSSNTSFISSGDISSVEEDENYYEDKPGYLVREYNQTQTKSDPQTPELIVESGRICLPKELTTQTERLKWNNVFQQLWKTILDHPYDEKIICASYQKIYHLYSDFLRTAQLYTKIIVNERFLPNEMKTIPPVIIGGIAGGDKYIREGILFKFASDRHNLYHGFSNSAKSAAHELKSLNSLMNLRIPGLCFPLFVVLDYRGFRVSAMSLLPIDNNTLQYGSSDGGANIKISNQEVLDKMNSAAQMLNLKEHVAGIHTETAKKIRMPVDIEAHIGKDGIIYVIDAARLLPPEPPMKDTKSFLFRLLRSEFVRKHYKPLCSDAFSTFLRHDANIQHHKDDLNEAYQLMLSKIIGPSFALWIETEFPSSVADVHKRKAARDLSLKQEFHKWGLNIRMLGMVYQHLTQPFWKQRFLNEMCLRVAKETLRILMRLAMERIGLPTEEPYVRVIVEYLNLLLGSSAESSKYWADEMSQSVKLSFFYHTTEPPALDDLHKQIDKIQLTREMLDKTGIVIHFGRFFNETFLDQEQPFSENQVQSINPTTKQTDIVRLSNAFKILALPYGRSIKELRYCSSTFAEFAESSMLMESSPSTAYFIRFYTVRSNFGMFLALMVDDDNLPSSHYDLDKLQRICISNMEAIVYDSKVFEAALKINPTFYEFLHEMAGSCISLVDNGCEYEWKMQIFYRFSAECYETLSKIYNVLYLETKFKDLSSTIEKLKDKTASKFATIWPKITWHPLRVTELETYPASRLARDVTYFLSSTDFTKRLDLTRDEIDVLQHVQKTFLEKQMDNALHYLSTSEKATTPILLLLKKLIAIVMKDSIRRKLHLLTELKLFQQLLWEQFYLVGTSNSKSVKLSSDISQCVAQIQKELQRDSKLNDLISGNATTIVPPPDDQENVQQLRDAISRLLFEKVKYVVKLKIRETKKVIKQFVMDLTESLPKKLTTKNGTQWLIHINDHNAQKNLESVFHECSESFFGTTVLNLIQTVFDQIVNQFQTSLKTFPLWQRNGSLLRVHMFQHYLLSLFGSSVNRSSLISITANWIQEETTKELIPQLLQLDSLSRSNSQKNANLKAELAPILGKYYKKLIKRISSAIEQQLTTFFEDNLKIAIEHHIATLQVVIEKS